MGKRPSNTLFYVFLSLIALLGLYIIGSLILDARDNTPIEDDEPMSIASERG